ncbi:uncharacterized protein LOC115624163 [Scaptodrosophila lebanonensis]|uniref:Uncharacterized protein LOC115624163 n=1 Tax=Drosophila lebanonensis TaxID=7225 RepID=A0A6J2TGP0_DROLE|nr:uncharacterized protein LOC115624163 [Scaptodrosophila lebanonensis]XP_030374621.1 uncharacterized protein LOC115624163 [Scaptodrosophila lebanonensis]
MWNNSEPTHFYTKHFLPSWLDQKELQSLVKQEVREYNDIIKICSKMEYYTQPALNLQIQLQLRGNITRTIDFLVKSREVVNSVPLKFAVATGFDVELYMYDQLLPALDRLYRNVGQTIHFGPKRLRPKVPATNISRCLYLDYMQAKGYDVVNHGLEKSAMQIALSKLAAYHAATTVYLQYVGEITELPKLLSSNPPPKAVTDFKNSLQFHFLDSLRSIRFREYEDKVKSFQRYVANNLQHQDADNAFNVILIGACSLNNLLCHTEVEGHIKDILFTDFGAATYGPAVYDIFHLFLTAPRGADKIENFDDHLKFYHEQLIMNLQLLGYKEVLPTLSDLESDLHKFRHWGFEAATEVLPISLVNNSKDLNDVFRYWRYTEQIKEILPWLENRGYLKED